MIQPTTVVVGVEPRITAEQFEQILIDHGSPAAPEAQASYAAIVAEGVDPLFMLAVFEHESRMDTHPDALSVIHELKNPGATRSTTTGVGTVIDIPGRGDFVRYPSYVEGFRDAAHRLTVPSKPYAANGAVTVAAIIPYWAPPSDGNSPEHYIAAVVGDMTAWQQFDVEEPLPDFRVALISGHHNTDGGNPTEYELVSDITEQLYVAMVSAGIDVRVVTPDGPDPDDLPGDGDFPGGLYDAARKVVEWHHSGWPVDVMLSVHTEGNGAGDAGRGLFAIYPDTGDDVDVDVRDTFGPLVTEKLVEYTGIPLRNNGLMSERQTAVGAQGHRLGIFRATEEIKSTCTRLIIEFGSHTAPSDLQILNSPEHPSNAAAAVVEALAEWTGADFDSGNVPDKLPDNPEVDFFPETGRYLAHGFRAFWHEYGGLAVFGYPITDEHTDEHGRTVQYFERARFEYHPEADVPHHVLLGRVGSQLLEAWEQAEGLQAELTSERETVEQLRDEIDRIVEIEEAHLSDLLAEAQKHVTALSELIENAA